MNETADYRLDPERTRALCQAIFRCSGMPPQDAEVVTDNLLFADLRGISTHGITRVGTYFSRARSGEYNVHPEPKLLRETPGSFLLDGDNGYGAVIGTRAMTLAVQRARQNGVCLGAVCRSNHFGAASYYTQIAAAQGMVGFCCTNSPPNMAPFGSCEAMLGTNPFSVAVPAGKYPAVVLDIASSVVARGNILDAAKNGKPIPDGWAIDSAGRQTTDAKQALAGAVLPLGGHKGSGIAVMIDILSGILSGAAFGQHILGSTHNTSVNMSVEADIGHIFLAVDISAFQLLEVFKARVDQMIEELKSGRKAPGVQEILYPGELEQRKLMENLQSGIPIKRGAYHELYKLCDSLGLLEIFRACPIIEPPRA